MRALRRVSRPCLRQTIAGWMTLLLLLSGCAVLPPREPLPTTTAVDGSQTPLGHVAAESVPAGQPSGFQLLPVASAALDLRLALARRATRSLDLQTFILKDDGAAVHLLAALRDAARRGVRVRVLVDDLHGVEGEELLLSIAREPLVEVRLFNPFVLGRSSTLGRLLNSLHELGRINHRMHNKLFVADNSFAIVGGRNTADEYFMRSRTSNFIDLEVLAAGRVVPDLSATFDAYWNSAHAYPIHAVAARSQEVVATLDERLASVAPVEGDAGVPERLRRYTRSPAELAEGRIELVGGTAHVFADPLEKLRGPGAATDTRTVRAIVAEHVRSAERDLFIVTPYLVPGSSGMQAMRMLTRRGVRVKILTNALAATDEPLVHGAYMRYRRPMLELGVALYELSPTLARDAAQLGRFGDTTPVLHAKAGVVDGRILLVGSMNLDGRSATYNTELGIAIDSAMLAADFLSFTPYDTSAYALRLDASGEGIEWEVRTTGGRVTRLSREPEASAMTLLKLRFLRMLVPEDWL